MLVQQNQYEPPQGAITPGGAPFNLLLQNLIPFQYSNSTLEIDFTAPIGTISGPPTTFPDTMMINDSGVSVPHFPTYFNFPASSQVRLMGGTNLVTELGPNFLQYVRVLYEYHYDTVTSIRVYSPGVVTKVQVLDIRTLGTWLSIINPGAGAGTTLSGDSDIAPAGNYVSQYGTDYNTTYVFTQPLTIEVIINGTDVRYFTLKSQISSASV